MEKRFERNIPAISAAEQQRLRQCHVLVAGCGGLGGYVIEYLARAGIGEMTAADGDVFEPTNLNRQILSLQDTLGESKALSAAERIHRIDPDLKVHAVSELISEENADELVRGKDLVIDALDNVETRLLLEEACARQGVILIHGAVSGWSMQAALVMPGEGTLHRLYGTAGPLPGKPSVLPFTPAFCAAVEAAEAVRVLCGREPELKGKLLLADLREMDWQLISVTGNA